MNAEALSISDRLEDIRARIGQAAARSGRSPSSIVLIGVTKTVPAEIVRDAVEAGLADLGENRVQEAELKIEAVGRKVRWHLVGHLQRNKAARAAGLFDRIHSVDDLELAERLSRDAQAGGKTIRGLVQVNVSGEASKHGVAPAALVPLLERASAMPGLAIDGLMSIGPLAASADETRRSFVRTRELRDDAERRLGTRLPELSMGMSADFEMAVEEGSTLVRVGTALFGPRQGRISVAPQE